jgi:hypothetical protein
MRETEQSKSNVRGVIAFCPEGRRLRGMVDGGRHTQTHRILLNFIEQRENRAF